MKGSRGQVAMMLATIPLLSGALQTARASTFQALCGGAKCSILVTPDEISWPYGSMPISRVTYWGNTGESKTSIVTGVTTTILFGAVGLLGFLKKDHNYNFFINGYDAIGKKVAMQFAFKNDKPVRLMTQELMAYTGLGMGQTRTIEEIKAAESGRPLTLGSPVQAEDFIGPKPTSKF